MRCPSKEKIGPKHPVNRKSGVSPNGDTPTAVAMSVDPPPGDTDRRYPRYASSHGWTTIEATEHPVEQP